MQPPDGAGCRKRWLAPAKSALHPHLHAPSKQAFRQVRMRAEASGHPTRTHSKWQFMAACAHARPAACMVAATQHVHVHARRACSPCDTSSASSSAAWASLWASRGPASAAHACRLRTHDPASSSCAQHAETATFQCTLADGRPMQENAATTSRAPGPPSVWSHCTGGGAHRLEAPLRNVLGADPRVAAVPGQVPLSPGCCHLILQPALVCGFCSGGGNSRAHVWGTADSVTALARA